MRLQSFREDLEKWSIPTPVLNNGTGRYKPFRSVYRTEESLKPPQLPKSNKVIEKEWKRILKPPIIPKVTHVRILKKCDECSKPRCIFSQYALSGKLSRKLTVKISELHGFHCGMDLKKAIDDGLSKKVIFIDRRNVCESPVENLVYRTKQANMYVCGWCAKDLKRSDCLKLEKSTCLFIRKSFLIVEVLCVLVRIHTMWVVGERDGRYLSENRSQRNG